MSLEGEMLAMLEAVTRALCESLWQRLVCVSADGLIALGVSASTEILGYSNLVSGGQLAVRVDQHMTCRPRAARAATQTSEQCLQLCFLAEQNVAELIGQGVEARVLEALPSNDSGWNTSAL